MYKFLFKPFYKTMHHYVSMNSRWDFPEIKLGHDLGQEELNKITEFRLSCYKTEAPYLVPKNEDESFRERQFDLNSYHIIARNKTGAIVGSLRLLKRPFELEELTSDDELKSSLNEYLEISRLVCSERRQGLGRRLLIRAGLWSIQQTSYRGFTAVCKCHRLPMFKRFGFSPKASFKLTQREGQTYHLIRADFSYISLVTFFAYNFVQLQSLLTKKPLV